MCVLWCPWRLGSPGAAITEVVNYSERPDEVLGTKPGSSVRVAGALAPPTYVVLGTELPVCPSSCTADA